MDFMPDREFHPLFDRVSRKVNLKGAGSPREINERLKKKIKEIRKKRLKPAKARRLISELKKLMFTGFGRRAIAEAIARPRGIVALTLKYGRKKAKEILLKRARERIGVLRARKRSRRRR